MNSNREQPTSARLGDDDAKQRITTEGNDVSESRRRFTRLGVGTPVILSLVSKPVLGAQCLSNMLSGNLSDPTRGNCVPGWSPGAWKNRGGKISTYGTVEAWTKAGFSYENSKASTPPFSTLLSGVDANISLVTVLRESPGSLNTKIICAYLNASLSEKSGGAFKYILTPDQVKGLVNRSIPVPLANVSLHDFLDSTWNYKSA